MSSPPSSDERESGKDSSGEDEPCGDSSLFLASSAPFSSPTPSPSSPPPTTSPSASSSQTASSSSTSLAPSSPSQNVPKQSSPTLSDRERDMKNLSSSPIASRKEEEEEEEEEKEEEEEEEDEDSEEDEGDEEEEEALVSEEDFQDDPTNNRKLDDFEMMEMVGSGTFGRLWKVRYTETGEQYAMKVLEKKQIISQDMVKHTILEKQVMDKVKHPFLCSLFCCFQTPRHIFLVMDYVSGGTLFYHLRNRPHPFTETETKFYATEILLALRALHDQDYVYRDLKLENILLDEDGHVRITDFGLSAKLTKKRPRVRSFSGSKVNLAPEVFSETNKTIGHGKSVDFWGLGVLLHLLLTHQAPIWHDDFKEHIMLVMYGKEVDFEDFPFLSNEAKSLLSQLLARDPKKRLGCRGETVGKRRKRGRRGGAGVEEVMRHPFFKGVDWEKVERKEFWKRPPVLPAMDFAMISEAELREQNSGGSGESGGGSVDEEEEQERGVCGEVYFSGFRRSMVVPKRRSRRASYRSVCRLVERREETRGGAGGGAISNIFLSICILFCNTFPCFFPFVFSLLLQ